MMAPVIIPLAISALSAGVTAYGVVQQEKAAKRSAKAAQQAINSAPKAPDLAAEQMKADQQASLAARPKKPTTPGGGRSSTLLTGPLGAPATPAPQRATLLGA